MCTPGLAGAPIGAAFVAAAGYGGPKECRREGPLATEWLRTRPIFPDFPDLRGGHATAEELRADFQRLCQIAALPTRRGAV